MLKKLLSQGKGVSSRVASVFVTLVIIGVLFLAGPASAITLGLTDFSSSIPNESTTVSFLGKVDLHTNDRIPLANVTVNITDGTSDYTCVFNLDGNNLTTCANFTVDDLSSASGRSYNGSASGFGYGYGYNTSYTYVNQSFGYGYTRVNGYGSNTFNNSMATGSATTTSEFIYNITWTTPSVNSNTTFNVYLYTNANGTVYRSKTASSFTVVNVVAETTTTTTNSGSSLSYSVMEYKLTEGYTNELNENGRLLFDVLGGSHTLTVRDLSTEIALIEIASTPKSKNMSIGEVWKVDLNNDGSYYDLWVKLNDIRKNRANVTIKSINEKISFDATENNSSSGEGTGIKEGEKKESVSDKINDMVEVKGSLWVWVLVIVILIAALYFISHIFLRKGVKKKRRYSIRR